MAAQVQPKGQFGWVGLKRVSTGGASSPAVNTITYLPMPSVQPRNPDNLLYFNAINSIGVPTLTTTGKKTPSVEFGPFPMKTSWLTAAFLNSLIGGSASYLNSYNDSDDYLVGINNGSSTRYWSGCRFDALIIEITPNGPQMTLRGIGVAGDSENSPGSITTPSVDPGSVLGASDVNWGASPTVDPAYSGVLTLLRPQAYQMKADGTLYSDTIQSGSFGGSLAIVTSPLATVIATTAVTLRLKIAATPTYVTFSMNTQRDNYTEGVMSSLGVSAIAYSLFNTSGAYPITIS